MIISTTKVSPLYNALRECIVIYTQTTLFMNILTGHCTLGHRTVLVYAQNFRPVTLMVFEILGFTLKNENDKIFKLAVGACCRLQTCNSVVNMLVMGLVLGQSLMVISTTGILLSQSTVVLCI